MEKRVTWKKRPKKKVRYGFAVLGRRSSTRCRNMLKNRNFRKMLEMDEKRLQKKYLKEVNK